MKLRPLLAGLAVVALVTSTAACNSEPEAPVAAAPEAPAGVTVSDGWLSLPAVAGNPGAVYFTIRNAGENDVMIRAVDVAGSESAMLHETAEWSGQVDMQELFQVAIPRGGETVFAPGGKHVMVMGLDETVVPGGETEVTLSFVNGDKASFPAKVLAAGTQP